MTEEQRRKRVQEVIATMNLLADKIQAGSIYAKESGEQTKALKDEYLMLQYGTTSLDEIREVIQKRKGNEKQD